MRNLSKSKLIAFRQCPKRLWLEIHQPALRDDSGSEVVFGIGNQVGEIARSVYDPESKGAFIDVGKLGFEEAFLRSRELLDQSHLPIFEAGLQIPGALAFADVMLPDPSQDGIKWKMIEVKSSTTVKSYHRDDLAIQCHIATSAGVPLSSASVAHINNQFIYQGAGDYRGLLTEKDLTAEASARHAEVGQWIADAQVIAASATEPVHETGPHCSAPFPCGFSAYCNRDKTMPEYPLSSLPRFAANKRELMKARGIDDLRHVPDEHLTAVQALVKQCTSTGTAYFNADGAAAALAAHGFPAYFLDYETANMAVPIWKGTRPYQQLPFQFSLHILEEDQTLRHEEFLDLSGHDPRRAFARSLIEHCGGSGPVYVYNIQFERRVTLELAGLFPDLAPQLDAIIHRFVDLLPIARDHYYHPSQHGRWGLKSVLPAAVPELSHDQLAGVQDGGMAVAAFSEAISPGTSPDRKHALHSQLLAYCKLDTLAMVRLWQFFRGGSLSSR